MVELERQTLASLGEASFNPVYGSWYEGPLDVEALAAAAEKFYRR